MPVIPRGPSIRASLRKVIIAPVGFLLVTVVLNWWVWVAALVLLLFSMLMAHEPLSSFVPGSECFVTMAGVAIVIMIAAVPLTIYEYFRPGSDGFTWIPTVECAEIARVYSRLLIEGKLAEFYKKFSTELSAEFTHERFCSIIELWLLAHGECESVVSAGEVEIAPEDIAGEIGCRSMDALIEVVVIHKPSSKRSVNLFHVNTRNHYQIVGFELGIEEM